MPCIGANYEISLGTRKSLWISLVVISTAVSNYEVFRYVVSRVGVVTCLAVVVKSYRILQSGTRASMSENFVQDIHVVVISVGPF